MQVKLVLNNRTVKCLQDNLGEGRVTILDAVQYKDSGSSCIQFDVKNYMDVLHLIHAGQDAGVELALYGEKGKQAKEAKEVVDSMIQ